MNVAAIAVAESRGIDGFMEIAELDCLARLAVDREVIVEVGSWKGRSTKALACASPGIVYAVDHWDGAWGPGADPEAGVFEAFSTNLAEEIRSGKVVPIRASSADGARLLAERGVVADMVFIDADHTYEAVKSDIEAFMPLLAEGGLLCGHDYETVWPGVIQAVNELGHPVRVDRHTTIWQVRP